MLLDWMIENPQRSFPFLNGAEGQTPMFRLKLLILLIKYSVPEGQALGYPWKG
jgi:hypothetical protein